MGKTMLPEVLTSLYELKVQLQSSLSQRPEYRALQLLERSALQLADALAPRGVEIRVDASPSGAPTSRIDRSEGRVVAMERAPGEESVPSAVFQAPFAGTGVAGSARPPVSVWDGFEVTERADAHPLDWSAPAGEEPTAQREAPTLRATQAIFLPFIGAPQKIRGGPY
jgi:hypothetical protein